jgi:hypothetical protein
MADISIDEQAMATAKQLLASYEKLQSTVQGLDVVDYGGPDDELASPLKQSLSTLRNTLVRFTRKLEDALAGTAEEVKTAITSMQEYDESLVTQLQQLAADASQPKGTEAGASARDREGNLSPMTGRPAR